MNVQKIKPTQAFRDLLVEKSKKKTEGKWTFKAYDRKGNLFDTRTTKVKVVSTPYEVEWVAEDELRFYTKGSGMYIEMFGPDNVMLADWEHKEIPGLTNSITGVFAPPLISFKVTGV